MKPYILYANRGGRAIIKNSRPLTPEAVDFCHGVTKAEIETINRREFIRRASGVLVPAIVLGGGLFLPRKSEATSSIITRTISAATETAISMSNATWARPVTLPVGWNKIRLGIRVHWTDSGASLTGSPLFAMGFCSGTTNQYGDATTTHFVGAAGGDVGTWTRNATSGPTGGVIYSAANGGPPYSLNPRKRIGTTNTDSTSLGSNNSAWNAAAASNAADRQVVFLDISSGSPNYTFQCPLAPGNFGGGTVCSDVSASDFLLKMGQLVPSTPTGYISGANPTLAVNEATNGTLNAVNLYWNRSDSTMEVCDVAVAVLA